MPSAFKNPEFQKQLAALIATDRHFLHETAHLLSADDFKPRGSAGTELWIIASRALDYYRKYKTPVGTLLSGEIDEYARTMRLSDRQASSLQAAANALLDLEVT